MRTTLIYALLFLTSLNLFIFSAAQQKASYNNAFKKLPGSYVPAQKPFTVIIYMAADNDLRAFAYRNLEEIKYLIRSTEATNNFHIFIHLDVHNPGQKKSTFHLMGYEKELCLIEELPAMDSGKEDTLVFACAEGLKYCPGEKVILGLWNHGTGALNPISGKVINPSSLYRYDPVEHKIVLNRSLGFLDYIERIQSSDDRAICFDDSTHNYLTNQKVGSALGTVCNQYRNGKKIDLIFCDACLMSSIEFMYEILPWAQYFIASEEVVLATGFRYDQVFNFFNDANATTEDFLVHCVKVFENTYQKWSPDWTLTSVQIDKLDNLYVHINTIARLLITALEQQKNRSVKDFIKFCSSKQQCTHFDEPSYKDLKHLFKNFLKNLSALSLNSPEQEQAIKQQLATELDAAIAEIGRCVVAHAAGKNLQHSGGISIYLPEHRVHPSFEATNFASNSLWYAFIKSYLSS